MFKIIREKRYEVKDKEYTISGVESRNSESNLFICVYYSSTLQGR